MAIAAVDVYYHNDRARAACVLFDSWSSDQVRDTYGVEIQAIQPYKPGEFFKRELPPILKVLELVNVSSVAVLIVDGYVYLDEHGAPGLGLYLYNSLQKKIAVAGVAKTYFFDDELRVKKVFRGESKRPLYVTAVGLSSELAAENVKSMAGANRIPAILKYLDQVTKLKNTLPLIFFSSVISILKILL